MFDILAIDTKTPSEKGSFMPMLHPVSGEKLRDSDGKEVGVFLRGRFSDAFAAARKENLDRRVELAAAGKKHSEDDEIAHLVAACTTGWTWTELDEAPFKYSPENAQKFWADPRFKLHADLALQFIVDLGNFMRR
jgi:hypothetical protein